MVVKACIFKAEISVNIYAIFCIFIFMDIITFLQENQEMKRRKFMYWLLYSGHNL